MEQVLKVVAVGIIACVLGVTVKKEYPTGTLLVSVAAAVVILFFVMSMLTPVKRFIDDLADAAGLSPAILSPLYKTICIAILTKVTAEACEDAKEKAFGIYVEIAGAVAALYVSLPLLSAVFRLIGSYLQT
jgi:stage III sporulation protein AD